MFTKSASFLLSLFIFLTLIRTVFAQENEQTSTEDFTENEISESDTVSTEDISDSPSENEVLEPEEMEVENSAMMSLSGVSGTEGGSVNVSNVGIQSSAPQVNTQDGSLQYEFPINVPPGRGKMTPDIKLQYNSNNTDNNSVFGYGWSVSIPHITRQNKTGIDKVYTSDNFESSMDGELVKVSSTTYKAKVDDGSFRKYDLTNNVWTVTEKDGTQYFFGTSTGSQVVDSASSTRIYSWMLAEIRDTNDNFILYSYYKHLGQIYPLNISYTGHNTTQGVFDITFSRESRVDALESYEYGFIATTSYRISQIETSINDSWVRRYELDYSTGHNGYRSLLASITESGRDESGTTTSLPSFNFTYETYTSSDKDWSEDESWVIPVNIVREREGYDDGVRFADINGDGLQDIMRSWNTKWPHEHSPDAQQIIYLNTGDSWASSSTWVIPEPEAGRFGFTSTYDPATEQSNVDTGARFADVNGDGYTDILWSLSSDFSTLIDAEYEYEFQHVYINNKVDGWATTTNWILPADIWFVKQNYDGGGRVLDINGDGLPDLLSNAAGGTNVVYFNTGNGWAAASSSWAIPLVLNTSVWDYGIRIVDVNGDGLPDITKSTVSDYNESTLEISTAYINTGTGWTKNDSYAPPVAFFEHYLNYNDLTLSPRYADMNGDGLQDIVSDSSVWLNTGEGWSLDSEWTTPEPLQCSYSSSGPRRADMGVAFMDVEGDNMLDYVKSGPLDCSEPPSTKEKRLLKHNGKVPDLLSGIEYSEGGEVEASYTQSALYEDGGDKINTEIPFVLNTVSSVSYDDGVNDSYSNSYTYGGGDYYYASSTEKKFSGFATTTIEDARGNVSKTYIHQGNTSQTSLGEYADSIEKIGKPYLTESYDSEDNLFSRSIYKWESIDLGNGSSFVFNTKQTNQQYDGDSDHKDSAVEMNFSSTTGNLLIQTEWGEVIASTTYGSFTDTGSDKRVTSYEYAQNTPLNILELPSQVSVVDQSSQKVRESIYYYDNLIEGSVSNGNLTKQEDWVDSTNYIDSRSQYNNYGLLTASIDPNGATTTYTYDTYNLYPQVVTNPLGQVSTSTFDYSIGKEKSIINPNGYTSETVFDGLDRTIAIKQPHPDTGDITIVNENDYTSTRDNYSVESTNYLSSFNSVLKHQYLDGFGRVIQERQEAEDTDEYIVRDWIYGEDGQLVKESLPYFDEDSSKTNPTGLGYLYISHQFDPLNREIQVANIVGTTTTNYDQWYQYITDPMGNQKGYGYDAYGRLLTVEENNASSTYITNYEWNLNDGLTKIVDALDNERLISYDGLGRRISLEDLHADGDTNFGDWSYTYDNAGNIISTTDPKGQTITNSYDSLNRVLTENYIGQAGTEITYTYDNCIKGTGYLCSVVTSDNTTTYTYSPNSKPYVVNQLIGGTNYIATTTYDLMGNVSTSTYPNGIQTVYHYDTAGNLNSISKKDSGSIFTDVVVDFDYGPHGQVSYRENGNGTYTIYSYDPSELYRLKSIKTVAIAGTGGAGLEQMEIESDLSFDELNVQTSENEFVTENGFIDTVESSTTTEMGSSTNGIEYPNIAFPIQSSTTAEVDEDLINKATSSVLEITTNADELVSEYKSATTSNTLIEDLSGKFIPSDEVRGGEVYQSLIGKNLSDRIELKSQALAKAQFSTTTISSREFDLSVKIHRVEKIEDGVQVFVSAWRDGKQLGFGEDGTVEIERIRIINPPILVNREGVLEEDLVAALEESVFHTVSIIAKDGKNIEEGKIGNTTTTAYPAAGANSPVDGRCSEDRYNNWNTTRNSTSCRVATVSDTGGFVNSSLGTGYGANYYGITRFFTGFDVSSIADSDILVSATLSLYGTDNNVTGSHGEIYVVSSSQSSASNLSTTDFDNVGSVSYGDTGSSFTTGSYTDIELNSTGLAFVSKTGVTQFALRPYYDFANVTPDNSNEFNAGWYAADQAGTTNDPKLIVEHGSNSAPTAPTSLTTEGISNPTMVVDPSPEFAAQFNDSNYWDYALSYQIQVSTTSGVWTNLVWDSNKVTLSEYINPGEMSDQIHYGGSPLESGTTYYWRLKFWDGLDTAGAWSTTTSSFSLAEFGTVQHLQYQYDAVGNILNIKDLTDLENPTAEVYTYDDLYRLTSVATGTVIVDDGSTIVTVQPDATDGKDTYYGTTAAPRYGVPTGGSMGIGGWGNEYFSYIEFPLDELPESEFIETANLNLYVDPASNSGNNVKILRITEPWTESGVTYWSNPGSTDIGLGWHYVAADQWMTVDITDLVKDWIDGTEDNYGIKLDGQYTYNAQKYFRTSDYGDSDYWPKLVVTTYANPLTPIGSIGTTTVVETYTYDALGNITNKSNLGNYSYLGHEGASYANPHAATSINGTSLTYDNNGNLLTYGSNDYTWDYRNRLLETDDGSNSVHYTYDHTNSRISKDNGTTTTIYPFPAYEEENGTSTVYLQVGNLPLVSIAKNGSTTNITHLHSDHLGSTRLVTDDFGYITQELDYYPFGDTRIDNQYAGHSVDRQFTGHIKDAETGLNYMGSRYQDGSIGKFISQDQANLDLGASGWDAKYNRPVELFLRDPQQLNTYSYARNNPIINTDPGGDIIPLGLALYYGGIALTGLNVAGTAYDVYSAVSLELDPTATEQQRMDSRALIGLGLITGSGKFADDFLRGSKVTMNRNAWSPGRVNNAQQSIVDHYNKHGASVGAKSAQDYYNRANDALKPGSGFTRLDNKSGTVDYYNPGSRELVGLNKDGQISTYHKVTNTNKSEALDYRVRKKQNERNGG